MQELSILPGHLRSPPFLVGFVLCDLLCLGSVLWIMVWPFVPFILAIVLSVLDCFNAFMFQKYCFSLICQDYAHFNLLLCCTVQWWYFLSLEVAILVLPIVALLNGCTLSIYIYIPVLWLFYPAIKPIAQFTEIVFRHSVDCDHYTFFRSVISFYTILSFLWSLLLPSWSCQFTLTCISSPFILCQIPLATFDLLCPLLPLSCVVVWCTHIRCFGHVSV